MKPLNALMFATLSVVLIACDQSPKAPQEPPNTKPRRRMPLSTPISSTQSRKTTKPPAKNRLSSPSSTRPSRKETQRVPKAGQGSPSVPKGPSKPPQGSPRETFQAAKEALKKKDYRGFATQLSPLGRAGLAGASIAMARVSTFNPSTFEPDPTRTKKLGDLLTRHGFKLSALTALQRGAPEPEKVLTLFQTVKDVPALFAEVMRHNASLGGNKNLAELTQGLRALMLLPYELGELQQDVQIEGHSATGKLLIMDAGDDKKSAEKARITFRNVDGHWRIHQIKSLSSMPQLPKEPVKEFVDKPVPWVREVTRGTLPTGSLHGELMGLRFAFGAAKYSLVRRWLTITHDYKVKGGDHNLNLQLTLPKRPSEGQILSVDRRTTKGRPDLELLYRKQGTLKLLGRQLKQYAMRLEFGKIKDGRMPVKLQLCLANRGEGAIGGSFELPVNWFHLGADGKPIDLTITDPLLQRHLAVEHLKRELSGKRPIISRSEGGIEVPWLNWATIAVHYRTAGSGETWCKVQLIKEEDKWKAVRTLRKDQVPEAHPVRPPSGENLDGESISLAAGRWLEQKLKRAHPGKGIRVQFIYIDLAKNKRGGYARAVYQLDGGKGTANRLLVKKIDGTWKIVRPLADDEEVDRETGAIRERK